MDRTARIGFNEAIFRDVNERIGALQQGFGRTAAIEIVCECGDDACMDRIAIAPAAYRRVREDPATFAVVPGHEIEFVEDVVEEHDTYVVVRKKPGRPEEIAEATA